jgi:hypothetical protein
MFFSSRCCWKRGFLPLQRLSRKGDICLRELMPDRQYPVVDFRTGLFQHGFEACAVCWRRDWIVCA